MECNTPMEQVPVSFLEDENFLTPEFMEMPILIAIEYSKKNGTPVMVFLCPPPPHGEGCGAQAVIFGDAEDGEEE